jgi:hypothetical protein
VNGLSLATFECGHDLIASAARSYAADLPVVSVTFHQPDGTGLRLCRPVLFIASSQIGVLTYTTHEVTARVRGMGSDIMRTRVIL